MFPLPFNSQTPIIPFGSPPQPQSQSLSQIPTTVIPRPYCNPSPIHITPTNNIETERGIQFEVGKSFFRHESFTGRDLGVLAASLHKTSNSQIRVLDAMCGCGIRSLRYLLEAEADFVLANDANDQQRSVIVSNMSQVSRFSDDDGRRRWIVTHNDANRVMTEYYLQRDFFDLIDVDSFGSDSSFLRSAYNCLKLGGLVYVTSTDGFSSGGHRPRNALASYGSYIRPMPFSNEIGLRMVIGGAVREAAVMGYNVQPLFSYYSYHGPVFRVMLRVNRSSFHDISHYGFITYCPECGNSETYSWEELGKIRCPCNDETGSLVVSGPLWTGALHDTTYLTDMFNLAEKWGWLGDANGPHLEKLLKQMIDESNPELPSGYIKIDEVSHRAKLNSPPLRNMISALQKEGYAACRSHINSNAIKTNCSMTTCMEIARELQMLI